MRWVWLRQSLLLWLAAAAILVAPLAWAQHASGEQEIREAVNRYVAGYASNTTEGYFEHYAKDVTFWWPNANRQTREAYHKSWDEGLKRGDNNVKSAVAEDVRVHSAPSGESGVASFLWKIERAKGDPYDLQTSVTYFKRSGKWEIVHMHFNRVARPAGGATPAQGAGGGAAGGANQAQPATRPAPMPSESGPAKEVAEVKAIIAKLTETYGANDLPGYFALYADNLTWYGPGGRSTKEAYVKSWNESVKTTGGLKSAETDDLRIQVAPKGDLAVASYLLRVTRNNPNEKRPANVTYQMSPTLIKKGGRWEIVHLHFQAVPPPRTSTAD
jgi:ketosteroid isomerase-like protein